MTRKQIDTIMKFFDGGEAHGDAYAIRITLRSGQVLQGVPRAHDNELLPMDGDGGGGPIVVVMAEIAAIEKVTP